MNLAMKIARTSLVQPLRRTASTRSRMTPMPNLISMGNTQAHFVQLFTARLALRYRGYNEGFLVFTSAGEVKYYPESFSFTVANIAAFTNMPVYQVKL